MERQSLRIVIVLGVLVTLVGGTGIFAVFTDRATTGQNDVNSGPRAQAADLVLNQGVDTGQAIDCGQDVDGDGAIFPNNLTTGLFSIAGIQPGDTSVPSYLCLQNIGAASLSLTASVTGLVDTENTCSGDEAAAGDTTCGTSATGISQPGELSPVIVLQISQVDCAAPAAVTPLQSNSLANWVSNPVAIPGSLAPGGVSCVRFDVLYPSTTPEALIQVAQTDNVGWRFAFAGTAQ